MRHKWSSCAFDLSRRGANLPGMDDRRTFLKGGAVAAAALPLAIRQALALPAAPGTGTLMDVQHVVILMQENRSFDHYFGTLRGVRGFSDPRPLTLPSGKPVWQQPSRDGDVLPFRLNSDTSNAQALHSLDHSWKGSHALWKNHDAWIGAKTPLTMGYFTRADLPFYYALADAFTICDAYHCSIFGPTNPNRMFLFTGTSGLGAGNDGPQAVINPPDEKNETADPKNDAPAFKPYEWTSYAERLHKAGIDWRVYQEWDNYGDNGLAYFAQFRGNADAQLLDRGRGWAPTSNAANTQASRGEHLIAQFAGDVAAGKLPQVSWIVAPTIACEHPANCPATGEQFTARLIAALTGHPDVWGKTVFILNYDENDGFFDHMPPPVPPTLPGMGHSTVALDGEVYHGEPVGLGPRVPMIVVSPWTKGGFVNSQLFDHTSVIRFLEKRFGVMEPNITPWRRSVCGDLTSVFDFTASGAPAALPNTDGYISKADAAHLLPPVVVPADATLPIQEPGQRPARPLPYDFIVGGEVEADGCSVTAINLGEVGIVLALHADGGAAGPWYYTVGAHSTMKAVVPLTGTALTLHGPGGYLRRFPAAPARLMPMAVWNHADQSLSLNLRNDGPAALAVTVHSRLYAPLETRHHAVAPSHTLSDRWDIAPADHWYDLVVECEGQTWRMAGHCETGLASRSDPAIGRV